MERLEVWRPALCISEGRPGCSFYQVHDDAGNFRPADRFEAVAIHIAVWKDPSLRHRRIRKNASLTSAGVAQIKAHLKARGLESGRDYGMDEIAEYREERHIGINEPVPEGWISVSAEPIALRPRDNPQRETQRCPAHESLTDEQVRFQACRTEFVLEQTVRAIIVQQYGAEFKEDNYGYKMLTETVPDVPGARKVQVAYKGAPVEQIVQAQEMVDLQFGPGRIEVI